MFSIAEAYERQRGKSSKLLAYPFSEFIGCTGEVLDVGCGTGALTFVVSQNAGVSHVVGVDQSQAFIKYAASRTNDARVRFEQGDAQNLEFPTSAFDCCVSLLLVGFLPNPTQGVREMARVTKRGGVIATAWWDHTGGNDLNEVLYRTGRSLFPNEAQPIATLKKFGTEDALVSLWAAAGLIDLQTKNIEFQCPFDTFQDYWEPLCEGQGPDGAYIRSFSAHQRDTLKKELCRKVVGASVSSPFALRAKAWAIKGLK